MEQPAKNTQFSYRIVIARYYENIEWAKQFNNVLVYNKGCVLGGNYSEIFLPNVGREGHTFYKHIYDNYDNLDDYTIFLQGDPFPHSSNVIKIINDYVNNPNLNIDFELISDYVIDCNLSGCNYHPNIPLIYVYEKLFNERKENMDFKFGAGGQFIVSKKTILKKPKEFYLKLVEMLQYDINPIEGFVIERFHKLIFTI